MWVEGMEKQFLLQKDKPIMAPKTLTHVTVGLGWNSSSDLDASVIMMDRNGELVDVIYYGKIQN